MNTRLKICQRILEEKNIPAFLVSNFYNIGYLSGFFPLSPQEREVFSLLTPKEFFLITDGRYIEQVKALKTGFTCLTVTAEQNFFQLIAACCQKLKIGSLAFEKENLTVSEYDKLKISAGPVRLIPTQNLVEEKRAIKNDAEIKLIKRTCQIADKTFDHLLGFIKPGLTEKEVTDEIEWFIRKRGVYPSFNPIVASGPNSAFPHHRTGSRRFEKQDLVLLDFGAKVPASPAGGGNYCSDMTRVVFLGKATAEQKKVYQAVLEAQKRAIEFLILNSKFLILNSGDKVVKASSVDKVARDYINSQGYPTIPHSLGHGVGLCEHENPRLSPKSANILRPGMVFSVEPGIYLPGKFGVRIEDLVYLTKSTIRVLTNSPKNIIEL